MPSKIEAGRKLNISATLLGRYLIIVKADGSTDFYNLEEVQHVEFITDAYKNRHRFTMQFSIGDESTIYEYYDANADAVYAAWKNYVAIRAS